MCVCVGVCVCVVCVCVCVWVSCAGGRCSKHTPLAAHGGGETVFRGRSDNSIGFTHTDKMHSGATALLGRSCRVTVATVWRGNRHCVCVRECKCVCVSLSLSLSLSLCVCVCVWCVVFCVMTWSHTHALCIYTHVMIFFLSLSYICCLSICFFVLELF